MFLRHEERVAQTWQEPALLLRAELEEPDDALLALARRMGSFGAPSSQSG